MSDDAHEKPFHPPQPLSDWIIRPAQPCTLWEWTGTKWNHRGGFLRRSVAEDMARDLRRRNPGTLLEITEP